MNESTESSVYQSQTLAKRLGITTHVSVLLRKVDRLRQRYPSVTAACKEDWLLDVANARGVRIVTRLPDGVATLTPPPEYELSNEELAVAICHPACLDRPQMIRAAAQLISRAAVDVPYLLLIARRERTDIVLAELARQALKVAPTHASWLSIYQGVGGYPSRGAILHWTRLANPQFQKGRPNPTGWVLAS